MVELKEITSINFDECVNLKVSDFQTDFVATNVLSMAQSMVYPKLRPLAIYHDSEAVGFTLFGFDDKSAKNWIVRLMIDQRFQGRGYGKDATRKIIAKMGEDKKIKEIYLCFNPGNDVAENLYQNIGFKRTGDIQDDGEIIMRYAIGSNRESKT